MTRWDTFPYAGEADMLECRLVELETVPDLVHVIVEADVDHQNHPKPYYYVEQQDRFTKWAHRIRYVAASGLPDGPDAWAREQSQREFVKHGLDDAQPDDFVFHGDVDEIPTALAVTYANPRGIAVLLQRFHPFAVDWRHPMWWPGTTVTQYRNVTSMTALRDARLATGSAQVPDAGWHFSWVGDEAARLRKINAFCHAEIRSTWEPHLEDCWSSGLHVDGAPLDPVTVNDDWPTWVREGHAPASWFRPAATAPRPGVVAPPILGPRPHV